MMNIETKDRIDTILASVFEDVQGEFLDEWGPNEIESWDSINHLYLANTLGEEFDISLDLEDIMEIETIGDIKTVLMKKGVS